MVTSIGPLKPFLPFKDELSISKGLLLRDSCLVIPQSMRSEVLNKIHSEHKGITKCRLCAISWCGGQPLTNTYVGEMISKCLLCCKIVKPISYQCTEPQLSSFSNYSMAEGCLRHFRVEQH